MNMWYETLTKPPFTPPNSYFPIAWAILYPLMLGAFAMIVVAPKNVYKKRAIIFFGVQLVFNLLWSYLFFDKQWMRVALIDLILILIFLLLTIKYFYKISKLSCYLLIPYLLQVLLAIYLNIGFIILN